MVSSFFRLALVPDHSVNILSLGACVNGIEVPSVLADLTRICKALWAKGEGVVYLSGFDRTAVLRQRGREREKEQFGVRRDVGLLSKEAQRKRDRGLACVTLVGWLPALQARRRRRIPRPGEQ